MKRINWLTALIIGIAFVAQMLIMWPSGSRYCYENRCGDYYWGVHEHDALWHMALSTTSFRNGSIQMPTYAGEKLTGYNWLIDYPIFALGQVGIPPQFTYFKLLPTIWFVLMIVVWRRFANQYRPKDEKYFQWLLFWLFFSNSLSYIFTLWHKGSLLGSSSLIAMQPPMMLINLQFAYTLPILGYLLVLLGKTKINKWDNIIIAGLLFVAMGLKFYGGAILLALVTIHSLMFRNWRRIIYAGVAILAAVFVFYQPKSGQGAILMLEPLATVYPIIEEKLLFYFPTLAVAKYSDNFAKQVIVGVIATIVFIIFNFATRLIALWGIRKWDKYEWSIATTIVVATLCNMLLVQRGEWWNTVQFLYYGFFLMGILAAKQMSEWNRKSRILGFGVGLLIIVLCLPNTVDTWRVFAQYPPGSYVSDSELEILRDLKKQPDGVVLALPLTVTEINQSQSPAPLHLRYESSYVSAYTGKVTFFNDPVQSRLVGIEYKSREQMIKTYDCNVLSQVEYIYVAGDQNQISQWEKCGQKLRIIKQNEVASLAVVE